jgi:hypothetical protein
MVALRSGGMAGTRNSDGMKECSVGMVDGKVEQLDGMVVLEFAGLVAGRTIVGDVVERLVAKRRHRVWHEERRGPSRTSQEDSNHVPLSHKMLFKVVYSTI